MIDTSKLNDIYQYMLSQLLEYDRDILKYFPMSEYCECIVSSPIFTGYDRLGEFCKHLSSTITSTYSSQCLDTYHRCLLLYLVINNKIKNIQCSKCVVNQYSIEKMRIAFDALDNQVGFYLFENDLFCKDLAVCAHRMFPGGVFKYELYAGVPRRALFRRNLKHVLQFSNFIVKVGGFRPFYGYHLDIRYRNEFTPDGCRRSFEIAAGMLELNKNIRGTVGSSWFYDPVIPEISPHLAYLRQQLEENGGVFFYGTRGAHITELALSSSQSRRKLFDEGLYIPTVYYGIWPREQLIRWAKTN